MHSSNWPASNVWVFIAQMVEHCSANAESTGSNPVEVPQKIYNTEKLSSGFRKKKKIYFFQISAVRTSICANMDVVLYDGQMLNLQQILPFPSSVVMLTFSLIGVVCVSINPCPAGSSGTVVPL